MEPITTNKANRSSSYEKILLVGFSILAVISPLYINQSATDLDIDEQPSNLSWWLVLLLILIITFLVYMVRGFNRISRFSSGEGLVGIGLAVLAVISPLFINRGPISVSMLEQLSTRQTSWLPLVLFLVVLAIVLSLYLDQRFTRFDPNWIHRVGGSSGGIIIILVILAIILNFKAE